MALPQSEVADRDRQSSEPSMVYACCFKASLVTLTSSARLAGRSAGSCNRRAVRERTPAGAAVVQGGVQPRWAKGGREVVDRQGDAFLAISFDPASGNVGQPTELFRRQASGFISDGRTAGYDVSPHGSRFFSWYHSLTSEARR